MKIICLFATVILTAQLLSAQIQEPGPEIINKLKSYFINQQQEKILISTDKSFYKPGETVWFRAIVTDENNLVTDKSRELFVKLYNSEGKSESQQLFRLLGGSASCDLILSNELSTGNYFLCAYTSAATTPEQVSITRLQINPEYSNQLIAETFLKDSISVSGIQNEVRATIKEVSGDIQKNTTLHFQLLNGSDPVEKGKVKTDKSGKISIPFFLPAKTNGDPFFCEITDNRDEWKTNIYLPTQQDSIRINFFPEGGTIIPGIEAKIGFTAFNKWGLPVDARGSVIDHEGKMIARVNTFTAGLGLFSVQEEVNQKLKLVLAGKTGQDQSFDLPIANPAGLALSVVKIDPEYITTNLQFADKLKHNITLTLTQGSNIYWAADLAIEKSSRIKIPVQNVPVGINLLSVFSNDGALLGERLVFSDQKEAFKITVLPEKDKLSPGEKMKIRVLLSDENNQPLSGKISIAIADQYRLRDLHPSLDQAQMVTSVLETPFSLISGAQKGKISPSALVDIFLISNRLKGFNGSKATSFVPRKITMTNHQLDGILTKNFESQLSDYVKYHAMKFNLSNKCGLPDSVYFKNNEGLFQKAPKIFKANTIALDNQRKMFSSASSILDVIKTIKPYKITNNQIVFMGSENSFNYQGGALIVLDGQQMGTDISALSSISPMDVDHINVSTNPMDIQRYTGLNSVGIIEIFQKKAISKTDEVKTEQVEKYENGFRIPAIFPPAPNNFKHDYRTTLLWIPEQMIDKSGQAEFSITASSITSDFIIRVEGISENGFLGSGQSSFSIFK